MKPWEFNCAPRLEHATFVERTPASRFLIVSVRATALAAASYELMGKRARRVCNGWIDRYWPAKCAPAAPMGIPARQERV